MKRFVAIIAILAITLVISTDLTIINTALDQIQREFSTSISQMQWVINAFALALAGFLIAMSHLADVWGRKKTLLLGISIFFLSSIVAGFAPSVGVLIGARFFLGISIAVIHPVTQVLMVMQYPSHQKKKGLALWIMALGIGLVIGPFLGGTLVTYFSWRMIFFVPALFLILGGILMYFFVHEIHVKTEKKVHPLDTILLLFFLFFLVFGIVEGKYYGWDSPFIIICFAISAFLLILLIFFERRLEDPMVPLALLKKPLFVGCCLINFSISFFSWTVLFIVPYYLQKIYSYTAFDSGLYLLFFAGGVILNSQILSLLKSHMRSKNMFFLALIFFALSSILQSMFSFNLILLAISLILIGLATPILQSHSSSLAFSLVEYRSMTSAAGFLRTCQTVGGMIGVSIIGSIITSLDLVRGYPVAFNILFFCALFMMLVVVFLIPSGKKRVI